MNQTEPNPPAQAQSATATADRAALLGPGSARLTVALLFALPVLLWGVAVAAALITGAGSER